MGHYLDHDAALTPSLQVVRGSFLCITAAAPRQPLHSSAVSLLNSWIQGCLIQDISPVMKSLLKILFSQCEPAVPEPPCTNQRAQLEDARA